MDYFGRMVSEDGKCKAYFNVDFRNEPQNGYCRMTGDPGEPLAYVQYVSNLLNGAGNEFAYKIYDGENIIEYRVLCSDKVSPSFNDMLNKEWIGYKTVRQIINGQSETIETVAMKFVFDLYPSDENISNYEKCQKFLKEIES